MSILNVIIVGEHINNKKISNREATNGGTNITWKLPLQIGAL